jgi:hypothetical protein
LDSLDGSLNYDRAVLNFGNVTCSGGTINSLNDTSIFIEWDAVMINTAVNNTLYWVSAGAEYNNQDEIWIGQAGFTSFIDNYNTSTKDLSFNMSGPSEAVLGASTVFHLDMYLPAPMAYIALEAFTPINVSDAMSVCSIVIVDVGRNYDCLQYNKMPYTTYASDSGLTKERARLVIGDIVNSGSREAFSPYNDSIISVEFVMYMPYNRTFLGSTLFIGAAVEIGTDKIWAGEIGVTITEAPPSDPMSTPIFTMNTTVNAVINQPFMLELNMSTPMSSETVYQLGVTTPLSSNLPQFKICNVIVQYQGINVPCFNPSDLNFISTSSLASYDQVAWNLSRIMNTGQRPVVLDAWANILQILIYLQPLDSALSGSLVSASMKYGTSGAKTLTTTVNIVASTSSVTNTTSPVVTSLFKFGTSTMSVNQSTDYRLLVAAYPQTLYTPVYLEITVPYDNSSTIFSICRVELVNVGSNLPCVNRTAVNSSVQYFAVSNNTGNYKAVVSLNTVCSLAKPNATFVPTVNDMLEFSVILKLENRVSLINGVVNNVGSALKYSSGILWQGSQPITVMNVMNVLYVNQTPFIAVGRLYNDTFEPTPVGSVAVFEVLIKTPPQSVADWTIRADVLSDPDLSICAVHVKQYGFSIPCLNLTTPMRSISRAGLLGRQIGWLDLYKLTNVGKNPLYADTIFDNNTVIVEVLVQVGAAAVVGSTHQVLISVDYGMNAVIDYQKNMSVNISSPISAIFNPSAPSPTMTFYQSPVNENATVSTSVYKGQTLILTSEITVPSLTRNDIVITIMAPQSPLSAVDLAHADVVFVGPNIPCILKQAIVANLTSWSGSTTNDVAVFNLGTVCHYPIDLQSPDNDKIRIEAIATIVRNSTVASGASFDVTAIMKVNGSDVTTIPLTFTLTDIVSNVEYSNLQTASMADAKFNVTASTVVSLYPADNYSVFVDVVVPANSTVFVVVDLRTPTDGISAMMTIGDISLINFGINLGSYTSLPLGLTKNCESAHNSSQTDYCYINVGKITNTGHTYRSDKYQDGDDSMRFLITLQMADAVANNKGSLFFITFGAKLGVPMLYKSLEVMVNRTLSEQPDLQLASVVNRTLTSGQLVTIDMLLYHSNVSRAEGQNVSIVLYLTKYVVFQKLLSISYLGSSPNVTNMTDYQAVSITFGHVYFTDYITFSIQLLVTSAPGASGSPELTDISLESFSYIIPRTGHIITAGTMIPLSLIHINFTTTPQSVPVCGSVALGMKSKAIADCQLRASTVVPGHQAINARLDDTAGWVSPSRLGSFDRHLDVYFGNLTLVTAITLQHPVGYVPVVQYDVYYSNDGINWVKGDTVSTVTGYGPTLDSHNSLSSPIEAFYLRLQITLPNPQSGMTGFKVEFYGCVTAAIPILPADLCSVREGWQKPTATPAQFYTRGFLVAGATNYFCDSVPNGDMHCYSSTDGVNYKAVDAMVINVIGFLPSINQLYGIANDRRAFLVSEDNGVTWVSVSPAQLTWASTQSGFVAAIPVPWTWDSTNLNSNAPQSPYISGSWGANFNGLYYQSAEVADWSACCGP